MTSIEGQTASRWRALERSVEMLWQFYAGSEVGVVEAAVHALVGGEAARACKQSLLATERVHRFQSAEALQVRLTFAEKSPRLYLRLFFGREASPRVTGRAQARPYIYTSVM